MRIRVKIRKFNPDVDKTPVWAFYKIPLPLEGKVSVLGLLQYIYEHLDPSLAFSGPCERGLCRACTVTINGKLQLACKTFVCDDVTIEPHPRFEVIRDLIIDPRKRKPQK